MPLSRSRDYLSIGEVLETIQADFPDVSISKIRFLEAEGLITPERTQSGYRKFYENDLARLKYILSLQRDHFLPLKVIRERLAEFDSNGGAPALAQPSISTAAPPEPAAPAATADLTDVSLSRDELLAAAGLDEAQLRGLEDFGLLAPTDDRYDGSDLTVAKAARGLMEFGVEARHLRMYRQLADREAGFIEQIVAPVARKRDPSARGEAATTARRLLELSRTMRETLVKSGLRELL